MSENRETAAARRPMIARMDMDDDACYRAFQMRDATAVPMERAA